MTPIRKPLFASTALCSALACLVIAATPVAAADMVISAPAPGATSTPSSNTSVGLLTVGDANGESGTLTIGSGITVDAATGGLIGYQTGATGTVNLTGSGATLTVANYLKVGNLGTGALALAGGAVATVGGFVYVGDLDDAVTPTRSGSGTLTLSGTGTMLTLSGLSMRNFGTNTSTLRVTDGAVLNDQLGFYGVGNSTIVIDGAGTELRIGTLTNRPVTWGTADGWFSIDAGDVTLSGGALLDTDGSYIGSGNVTTMRVSGSGTRWLNGLPLYIGGTGNGDPGNGTVTVSDGAYVRSSTSALGVDPGSTGMLTVTGAGTIYEVVPNAAAGAAGNMRIGFNGTGTATVSDGALLKAANQIQIAGNAGSVGVLNIGAAEGSAAAAAGRLDGGTLGVVFGDGDGTLVFNHTGTDYTFDQTMSGTNATIKHLAGVTHFTAASPTLQGTAFVSGGQVHADAALGGLAFDVSGTGVLAGSGTVGATTIRSGATLAPGNSPGTLTVTGNLTQAAGSIYRAELVPGSAVSDLVAVTGSATIAPGAILQLVKFGNAPFALDASYTVLTATGGITGTYTLAGDTAISAFYTLVANGTTNSLILQGVQTQSFASVALTPNQTATAARLGGLAAGSALRLAVAAAPTAAAARTGFDQLSGDVHASVKTALIDDSRFVREATAARLADAVRSAEPGDWTRAYGAFGTTSGDGNAAGFDHSSGGVFVGADREIVESFRLGLVGGYGHSTLSFDDGRGSADVDSYGLGAYGGGRWGAFGVALGLNHTWNALSVHRSVSLPGLNEGLSSKYEARTAQAYGEANYTLAFRGVSFAPFAGLAHVHLDTDGFRETGGTSALSAAGSSTDVTFATLGLRASGTFDVAGAAVTARGMLGGRHSLDKVVPTSTNAFATSGAFTVSGVPVARDVAVVEAGFGAALSAFTSVNVDFNGQYGSGVASQGVNASLNMKF